MRTYHKLRRRDFIPEGLEYPIPVKRSRGRNSNVRAELRERARHGIVLIARHEHPRPFMRKRPYRNVERMRRIHREHYTLRLRDVKELRCVFTAAENYLRCRHRRYMPSAAGACGAAHRIRHRARHGLGLYHGRCRVVKIDHLAAPPYIHRSPRV